MPVVLVVQHTPSPATQALLEAVLTGARTPDVEGVTVQVRAALSSGPADLLAADGVILGTPANIGTMSGALKHWFDGVYYPCLEVTRGLPYGLYVHGNDDTAGAVRSVERITAAMQWRPVAAPVTATGAPDRATLEACEDLGGLMAYTVAHR